jgi:Tol biopolymer transport system component
MNIRDRDFRLLDFQRPNDFGWGASAFFKDQRRIIVMSLERGDWGNKSFYEYYHKIRTHLWIHDLESGSLTEIATKQRLENFYAPSCLLPGEERMIAQVITENGKARLFSMDLDGSNAQQIIGYGEGFPYGATVSPDGKRLAFHLAGPAPHSYRVFTSDLDGRNRTLVAGQTGHLYFGYDWSPNGDWILYQDCEPKTDPGHDWSDICIARPDGSEHKILTQGKSQWFGASWGTAKNPGGGSNMPKWSPDGSSILFSQKLPGSKTPWEPQPQRKDTDHFNRDYKPEAARGAAVLSRIHVNDGSIATLSHNEHPQWEMYPDWSRDGKEIIFCRAAVGEAPAIWVMDTDGKHARFLTRGLHDQGAIHPRWLPG